MLNDDRLVLDNGKCIALNDNKNDQLNTLSTLEVRKCWLEIDGRSIATC